MRTANRILVSVIITLLTLSFFTGNSLLSYSHSSTLPIESQGTIRYPDHRTTGVWGINAWTEAQVDPQEVVDRLRLNIDGYGIGQYTWGGGWLGNLDYLLAAGVKHIVPTTIHTNWMSHEDGLKALRDSITPSLDHPEICGVFLDEYPAGRNEAQIREVMDAIRTINPNLQVWIPWNSWFAADPSIDIYLSWLDGYFHIVCLNFHVLDDEGITPSQLEPWINRTRETFPGKPVWVTIYSKAGSGQQGGRDLTEQEFKAQLEILRNAYDTGRIEGVALYIGEYLHWTDALQYVDWFAEGFV